MTIEEKKQRIQPENPDLSIERQCELIGLPLPLNAEQAGNLTVAQHHEHWRKLENDA
jgi:hypothetical protein